MQEVVIITGKIVADSLTLCYLSLFHNCENVATLFCASDFLLLPLLKNNKKLILHDFA